MSLLLRTIKIIVRIVIVMISKDPRTTAKRRTLKLTRESSKLNYAKTGLRLGSADMEANANLLTENMNSTISKHLLTLSISLSNAIPS